MDKFMKEEKWEVIDLIGVHRDRYEISTLGKVYDRFKSRFIEFRHDLKDGFARLTLAGSGGAGRKNFVLHNLMLQVFKPKEWEEAQAKKYLVKHKDGKIRNNDLDNLEFASRKEVMAQRKGEFSKILK
jgi:hypothetical protein